MGLPSYLRRITSKGLTLPSLNCAKVLHKNHPLPQTQVCRFRLFAWCDPWFILDGKKHPAKRCEIHEIRSLIESQVPWRLYLQFRYTPEVKQLAPEFSCRPKRLPSSSNNEAVQGLCWTSRVYFNWATKKTNAYFPVYWLLNNLNRDPYNSIL